MNNDMMVYNLYKENMGMIRKIVRRYLHIDPAIEESDLIQEAIFPTKLAAEKLKQEKGKNITAAKASTILYFFIVKHMNSLFKNSQIVKIIHPKGQESEMTYSKYQKVKKSLPEGCTVNIMNPFMSCKLDTESEIEHLGVS